ncbi:MAG: ATP-binding cassette domain-containing protein, partial [Candidatus Delongbacteria bacterium]|nr:ATP-binding cassette domain-containing protein [Candidatus Delongbacteria bacterium]
MIGLSNITKNMGGVPLYTGASFQIHRGEKIGLVGPNGTGKTTFFRLIVGELKPDVGTISIQNNTKIAYFSQNVGEMSGRSAVDEVISGNARISLLSDRLNEYHTKLSDPKLDTDKMAMILEKMGDDQAEYEANGGYE